MLKQTQKHRPVLVREVLQYLQPRAGESYLDLTAGYGGHAQAILSITDNPKKAVLVDRDAEAVNALKPNFKGAAIVHQDFLVASTELAKKGRRFDMILADLGVSSPHLEDADRGFSIQKPGALDMRMDQRQEITAGRILNSASETELTKIFSRYGEEPKARKIARRVIEARPLQSTDQLAALVATAWYRRGRTHPATRVFQALRIAVNDELGQLEQALPIWLELLEPGGRMAIISFHSLEDRLVKHFFAEHVASGYEGELKVLTKKPIAAKK